MDRFEEMQTFVRVAETLSVTRAATQMNIAPSAISRRIRDLETRLGAQLLQRTTRRINLTDAGRAFYRRCLQLLSDIDEAETEAAEDPTALAGTLRLTVPLSLGLSALTETLTDFMCEHPELVVHVDMNDRMVDLVAENIDLAIRVGQLSDSSLVARKISEVRHLVCASPAFLERHGTPRVAEDLTTLPALCYTNVAAPAVWRCTTPAGQARQIAVTPRMTSTNGDALREAAVAGLGVVFEPSFIVYRQIERGELVPLLTDHDWQGSGIYAVYPPTRHLPARARAFVEFLSARFGAEPYWETCMAGDQPDISSRR